LLSPREATLITILIIISRNFSGKENSCRKRDLRNIDLNEQCCTNLNTHKIEVACGVYKSQLKQYKELKIKCLYKNIIYIT